MTAVLSLEAEELLAQLPQRRPVTELTADGARAEMAASRAAVPRPAAPMADVEDVAIAVSGGRILMRRYQPWPGARGLTVFFHGGGFVLGDLESHDSLCRAWAHAAGCEVLAVDYRRAPEHPFPAAVHDAYAALEWGSARASATGAPLAVAGDSAGATLATAVTRLARDRGGPSIARQVLVYPPVRYTPEADAYASGLESPTLTAEAMAWYWRSYVTDPRDGMDPRCSPLLANDLSGLPAALIVRAGVDVLAPEVDLYAARLVAAAVPVQVLHYDNAFHGFLSFHGLLADADDALAALGATMRATFAGQL